MSVIQKIRDKYARWAVIAIAVSLLGFILMDAFAGRTGLFSNRQSNTLGKVNGTTIDATEFSRKVQQEEAMESRQGYEVNDERRQQINEQFWQQQTDDLIMKDQYEELGLTVGDKELKDILYGSNPPDFIKQPFTDPKTGVFDAVRAQQEVNRIMKSGSADQKQQITEYFNSLKSQRLMSKYMGLLANTIYFPKWLLEKRNVDNSLLGKISYVSVPYATVSDSTVKVTDSEIEDYIKDHKKDFEQKEETRSINYVTFSAAPSSADSAAVKDQVAKMKPAFDSAKDAIAFVNQQNSDIPPYDGYLAKSAIQVPAKDSILALPKGGVFGPYLDANTYVLAKMIDSKVMPDSAKAKHILIQTNNPQTGQVLLDDSTAKARIDSIKNAIDHGANFDSLAKKYSDDKSSAEKGGLLSSQNTDYFAQGQMVKAFNDFVFNGKVGQRDTVKTEFGYHLIQILDLKNVEPHYKIAYLGKKIVASPETVNEANNQANMFAGDSRDQKAFNENFDKNLKPKGINKLIANDIRPMDYNINGMSGARSFVKAIFAADKGDVIGPEQVGDNYVVAVVTEVNEPGLQSVNKVRPIVEPILRNKKKSEQIIKNIGQVSSLEQVAAKENQQVQAADSLRFSGGNSVLGYEPKILGAVFNPANKGKITPALAGTQGVYVVRVDNVTTTPVETASIEDQRKMMEMQMRQSLIQQISQGYNPIIEPLRKAANIKDNRAKFF
jgi:peptidyl-prolyl cis-trans isomerase D